MDGRAVVHGSPVDGTDEEEVKECVQLEEGGGQTSGEEHDEAGDTGREVVLSRDEFDLLQAFHRVIPLPALSSKILRVFVDEDLQVPETAAGNNAEPSRSALLARAGMEERGRIRSSPLTNRLGKRGSDGAGRKAKPHFEINLSARTANVGNSSLASSALGSAPNTMTRG